MTTGSPVISADSHIQEPLELYEERLPKKYRHRTPRTMTDSDGAVYRVIDGKRPRRIEVIDALPRSAAGKVLRTVLGEQFAKP